MIHEWDYITYLIGFPKSMYRFEKHLSSLEINSEDLAIYIADYGDKTVELHLDYFGRKPIRRLELFTMDDTIECDLIDGTIHFLKENRKIKFDEQRDDYQIRELETFMDILEGKQKNENPVAHACKVLNLIQGYESTIMK